MRVVEGGNAVQATDRGLDERGGSRQVLIGAEHEGLRLIMSVSAERAELQLSLLGCQESSLSRKAIQVCRRVHPALRHRGPDGLHDPHRHRMVPAAVANSCALVLRVVVDDDHLVDRDGLGHHGARARSIVSALLKNGIDGHGVVAILGAALLSGE